MSHIYLHWQAEIEFEEAIDFYEIQEAGLGKAFNDEVASAIERLKQYPESGSPVTGKARKVILTSFPYHIFYQTDGEDIFVAAIVHQKRNPKIWETRFQ